MAFASISMWVSLHFPDFIDHLLTELAYTMTTSCWDYVFILQAKSRKVYQGKADFFDLGLNLLSYLLNRLGFHPKNLPFVFNF